VAAPALVLLAVLDHPVWSALPILGLAAMLRRPLRRLRGRWGQLAGGERALALLWLPVVRVVGDVAKMAGYPVGIAWRLRERPPAWRAEGAAMGRWLR
jgi:hypothetical protein